MLIFLISLIVILLVMAVVFSFIMLKIDIKFQKELTEIYKDGYEKSLALSKEAGEIATECLNHAEAVQTLAYEYKASVEEELSCLRMIKEIHEYKPEKKENEDD